MGLAHHNASGKTLKSQENCNSPGARATMSGMSFKLRMAAKMRGNGSSFEAIALELGGSRQYWAKALKNSEEARGIVDQALLVNEREYSRLLTERIEQLLTDKVLQHRRRSRSRLRHPATS